MQPIPGLTLLLAVLFLTAPAHASGFTFLDQFSATGERQDCIRDTAVLNTLIVDDATILFRMRDGRAFLNRLPERCEGLSAAQGFGYSTGRRAGLCAADVIIAASFCSLGRFERLVRRTTAPPVRSTAAR